MATKEKGLLEEWESPTYGKERDKAVTAHFRQTNKSNQQAIVKITGFGSSVEKVGDHVSYLTRNGEHTIEDEQGNILEDKEEIEDILEEWGADFSRKRPSNNIVSTSLTVNIKTPEKQAAIYKMLKEVAAKELSEFTYRVDKSRSKTRPNDVTLRVKSKSLDLDDLKSRLENLEESHLEDFKTTLKTPKIRLPRDVVKVMLSSPEHTDPKKLMSAVRAFAEEQYGSKGHRYLMALHEPKTDKKTEKYPHVHLVVKMKNDKGERISTSRDDLYQWRKLYAEKAREQGIMIEASYRSERGKGYKAETRVVRERKNRKEPVKVNDVRKESALNAHKDGIYRPSKYEVSQLIKHLKERQEYARNAQSVTEKSELVTDPEEKRKMRIMANTLRKEANELPIPKTKLRLAIDELDEKLGTKTRIQFSEIDKIRIEKEGKILNELTTPTKESTPTIHRSVDLNKGDDLEL